MPTTMEIYRNFALTAIELPDGRWLVELVRAGGAGKPFLTLPWHGKDRAMDAARRTVDNGPRP
jgi:hypothetical protein